VGSVWPRCGEEAAAGPGARAGRIINAAGACPGTRGPAPFAPQAAAAGGPRAAPPKQHQGLSPALTFREAAPPPRQSYHPAPPPTQSRARGQGQPGRETPRPSLGQASVPLLIFILTAGNAERKASWTGGWERGLEDLVTK
jgi:hypothetical protein